MGIKQLVIVASLLSVVPGLRAADAPAAAPAPEVLQVIPTTPPVAPAPAALAWTATVQGPRIRVLVKSPGASDAGFDVFRYADSTVVRYQNAAGDPTHEDSFSLLPHETHDATRPNAAVGQPLAIAERKGDGWSVRYLDMENKPRVAYAQPLPEGVMPPQPAATAPPEVVPPLIASHSIAAGTATYTFLLWPSRPADYFVVRSLPGAVSVLHVDAQGGMVQQDVVEAPGMTAAALDKLKSMVRRAPDEAATPLFAVAQRGYNGWNISYVDAGQQATTLFATDAPVPLEAPAPPASPAPEGRWRYWAAAGAALLLAAAGVAGWLWYRRKHTGKAGVKAWKGPAQA
ncbi:MAG: hypothetical protein V4505_13035 [Pseudomonadota bacterium]